MSKSKSHKADKVDKDIDELDEAEPSSHGSGYEGDYKDSDFKDPEDKDEAKKTDKEPVARVAGYSDLVDTILRFTIEQAGASLDKEVYRCVVEKHVDSILADCKDLNPEPK